MKITVSDLEGEQLAEWAARAQGWSREVNKQHQSQYSWRDSQGNDRGKVENYRPDINSTQAMELLENDEIVGFWTYTEEGKTVYCVEYGNEERWAQGATLKIAACRARIVSVFGEYVTVEDE